MRRVITFFVAATMAMCFSTNVEAKPVDKAAAAQMAERVLGKAVVDATPEQFYLCHLFAGADGWDVYHPLGGYYTWLLRAVLDNSIGIAGVESGERRVETDGRNVRVDNPNGESVSIYDVMGRCIATSHFSPLTFQIPAAGVYIIRLGEKSQKIVVR